MDRPEIAGRNVEHKLGGEDRPFHLSIAPIWQIPIGRGQAFGTDMPKVLDAVVGGWQFSGQFNIQSGVPVVFGTDSFFSGKDFALPKDQQSLNKWFDTTQFQRFPDQSTPISDLSGLDRHHEPARRQLEAGRRRRHHERRLPGLRHLHPQLPDALGQRSRQPHEQPGHRASTRTSADREKLKLQYRFESYNTFNHAAIRGAQQRPDQFQLRNSGRDAAESLAYDSDGVEGVFLKELEVRI